MSTLNHPPLPHHRKDILQNHLTPMDIPLKFLGLRPYTLPLWNFQSLLWGICSGTTPTAADKTKTNRSVLLYLFFSLLPSCWFVHYLLAFSYFRSQQLSLILAVFFQVFIHPKSVNFQANKFDSPYLVYHEKVKTSKVQYSFNPQFISSLGLLPVILQKN